MEKIYILDAINYLFRSYYAIGPMTNPKGESTSAVYGFIRSLQKLIKDFSPDHLVAIFDGPDNRRSRTEIYEKYKAHREEGPKDLYPQIKWAYEYCKMAGIPTLQVSGVEADDTIASVALWAKDRGATSYMCTSDKDLFQLVSDKIYVINVHKQNMLIDEQKVKEIHGVRPDQMLDLLSIMGDKSDNIPGVEGFGPKTAAKLLQEFETLDYIIQYPEKIPGKKKQQTFIEQTDQALLSKKLATLNTDIDFPKNSTFFEVTEPDIPSLKQFYQEMKFTTLLKDFATVTKEPVTYTLTDSLEKLEELVSLLNNHTQICVDTETTKDHPLKAELIGIGFSIKSKEAFYVPLNGSMDKKIVIATLDRLFSNPNIGFFGHNIKFDCHVLKNHGLKIKKICFDTLLASYLLNPQNRQHGLDQITLEIFDVQKISYKSLTKEGRKEISLKEVPIEKVATYCCEDVDYTYRLKDFFDQALIKEGLDRLFYEMELPLIPILIGMEEKGIFLDHNKLSIMSKALDIQLTELETIIHEQAGVKFNIKSPKQLAHVLYEHMGLTPPRKKISTAANILEELSENFPIVSHVLEYRALEKLRSTYTDALPKQINTNTNRVHCTFNQSVTATGRLSCQDPNLQNIPVRSEQGKKIREGFMPQNSNWVFLSADYSQIELRLLAHFSDDPELIRAFESGEDIHTHTASLVFGVPIQEVTKEMRKNAKAVNFGILYGQSSFGLSKELGIPVKEAKAFIERYFNTYKNIRPFIEKCIDKVNKTGFATTLSGRKRPIPDLSNKNPHIKAAAERLAANTPLQGTAADVIKKAMIEIDYWLKKETLKGFMILQVHDELIFEIPREEVPIFTKMVKNIMENTYLFKIPLIVDIEVGKNWGEC